MPAVEQQLTRITGKSVSCLNCTSHVYHHQEVKCDDIVVRTGLLKGGKSLKPGDLWKGSFPVGEGGCSDF